jgi:hypothetical protein
MTESEMYLVGDLLYYSGKNHVVFDERSEDKRLLLVSKDVPTIARYILASPSTNPVQKMFAEDSLKEFMAADDTVCAVQQTPFQDNPLVMYCASDLGQLVDSQSPDFDPLSTGTNRLDI